ncbi:MULTISPECIES: UDP-3-O-acyl-N-acetylglucosamine deacetylase [Paracoccus]|jgi:UDP-3-O-[3-hydroxymyristoyl] N-acetylglucosamine deacetylase|uniref:UDP-3-O-acyl-N-acetylglucosamine deacetylase n=1 Tax=Paracoccus denitrificans (strain Pd 1222) TaxID=318586 RepID=A1BAK6_PARDP|nr:MULTISPECIES: UDP-3-O-acyl-N-acetylglucosamine deacetylase [Paracoccus]ABL72550.1 UDP-3-O-[3-hydroxymyristoyl] N-acetylglucosamine deacetylase [Paracoccus denitrificans PD1222]MBB4626543.1 UDP-3-O-[3-hydroxymyristoyl] N-acetylglucosamine deacetylase [Paracoccus denitrificans]MCU7428815.1 UDP-3-O-acyl-N-acetylglucosamine deacetylase [Paracoccus denitrificans]MDK8872950.1 UDP-3-O-acyl-N-acetylglucosamine deacetylase [Paracoccus sp. SSJ]QAR29093.1 UDP-3-O-acyl-N-acetylglucosamine deacetylase [
MQTTIAQKAQFRGVGLHSGAAVRLTILPAPADHGIVFVRTDLDRARIPANWDHVTPSQLCTLLDNGRGATVSTVEHVMAALSGTGINNAVVEVNGPEVPILDGSSAPFVQGILEAGLRQQHAPLRAIRVLREVEVQQGEAFARLSPADHLEIHFDIDFVDAAIGHQEKRLDMANGSFVHELMDSRTFCRQADVVQMQRNGLALGGTYLNAVVVDGDKVLSPGGLRHRDEAVRHKMLDAVGDLALAGAPLLARYTGHRAGHAMTNKLLRALFAQPDAWEWVTLTPAMESRQPGAGVIASAARLAPRARQLAVA